MPYSALRFINLEVFITGFIILYPHSVLLNIELWVQVIKVAKSGRGGTRKPRLIVTAKNTYHLQKQPRDVPFHFTDVHFTHKKVPWPAPYILFEVNYFCSSAQGSKQLNCNYISFSHSEDGHFKQFNINFRLYFSVCSCWEVPLTFWKFGVLI